MPHCNFCGTNVKVVGHTTMHYEPVVDREELLNIIRGSELYTLASYNAPQESKDDEKLADAIISAMYGTVDNVATVGGEDDTKPVSGS